MIPSIGHLSVFSDGSYKTRMPIYRARSRVRTRQFYAFPPFSPLTSHMTIKRRVFVVIMEGLGLGVSVSVSVRVMVKDTEKLVATGVLAQLHRTTVLSETNSLTFSSVIFWDWNRKTDRYTHFYEKNSFSSSSITNERAAVDQCREARWIQVSLKTYHWE